MLYFYTRKDNYYGIVGRSFTANHIFNSKKLTKAQALKTFTDMMRSKGYIKTSTDDDEVPIYVKLNIRTRISDYYTQKLKEIDEDKENSKRY